MNFSLKDERFIHSIKTGLACLIGFFIAKLTTLPVGQWLVITILVVMCAQVNVGSMIQKSYMRFLGTLTGSLAAAFTLMAFGTDPVVVAAAISIAAMFFSYIASSQTSISESGTLGAVTITIILVSPNPTFTTVISRFLEISAGILIAALISQFVLPIHARKHLRLSQSKTFKQLRAYYLATLLTNHEDKDNLEYHEIDENIIKSLLTQRKLATEAVREPLAEHAFVVKQFSTLLRCEREILRAITFMHHAYKSSPEAKKIFSSMLLLSQFHDKVCEAFNILAIHFEKKITKTLVIEIPSIQPVKDAILAARNEITPNDSVYTDTYLFCSELLVARLTEIVTVIQK